MISKAVSSAIVILALCFQVNAHAAIAPALGVAGTPVRNDVKRPNTANPCGAGVDIATTLDSSTAVTANAAGSFNVQVLDFNAGTDGSRQVTAKVDATGKGTNFVAATVTTNGDPDPSTVGSQAVVASLPSGTKCTGGSTGNKCLVQFVTSAGFGNCVVVSQGAAGNKSAGAVAVVANPATPAANTSTGAAPAAAAGTGGNAAQQEKAKAAKKHKKGKKDGARKQGQNGAAQQGAAGTRAARSLLAGIQVRDDGESNEQLSKRGLTSWIWA